MASRRQHGYVLLSLLLVLFVSGSSYMLTAFNNRQSTALKDQQELIRQLAEAKAALLAYAASTPELFNQAIGPGYLPCPDTDNSGLPDVASGSETDPAGLCPIGTTLGRLPQYVPTNNGDMKLNNYYAGVDRQFWYAVSSLHLRTSNNTPSSDKTNSNLARLTLDGTTGIAALIFAPGEALETQDRISSDTLYSNYLDGTNGSNASNFISTYTANPELFNDTVIAITHSELMQFLGARMTDRIQAELASYHEDNNDYPTGILYSGTYYAQQSFFSEIANGWLASESWNSNNNYCCGYRISNRTYYTTYSHADGSDAFSLRFFGCTNMTFSISIAGSFSRTGESC